MRERFADPVPDFAALNPGYMLRCAQPRSTARPSRPSFDLFVGGLLGNSEMIPDLPPERAGLTGPRHGLACGHAARHGACQLSQRLALRFAPRLHSFPGFLRSPRIRPRPAVDIGLVDDPAQTSRPTDHRVARYAERFCDLGSGTPGSLLRQQPFVTRWRPARRHGGPILRSEHHRHGGMLPQVLRGLLTPVTRITGKGQGDGNRGSRFRSFR